MIKNSSISPKPECEILDYIWNWRDYISEYLTVKELKNHSFYNAFNFKKEMSDSEGMVTKMRCKRLPQDDEWEPPTGIRLVKPNTPYDPVPSADFRVDELMLPKLWKICRNISGECLPMSGYRLAIHGNVLKPNWRIYPGNRKTFQK